MAFCALEFRRDTGREWEAEQDDDVLFNAELILLHCRLGTCSLVGKGFTSIWRASCGIHSAWALAQEYYSKQYVPGVIRAMMLADKCWVVPNSKIHTDRAPTNYQTCRMHCTALCCMVQTLEPLLSTLKK